jgi:hypothetical protein
MDMIRCFLSCRLTHGTLSFTIYDNFSYDRLSYKNGVIHLPTQTFFNLPQEKKNKIMEAIKNEVARVPFEKVSTNKIVQDANISRGSFYMLKENLSC